MGLVHRQARIPISGFGCPKMHAMVGVSLSYVAAILSSMICIVYCMAMSVSDQVVCWGSFWLYGMLKHAEWLVPV